MYNKIIPCFILNNGKIIDKFNNELQDNIIDLAKHYSDIGADEIMIIDKTDNDVKKESFVRLIKEITRNIEIPLIVYIHAKRLEDVKKVIYAGASSIIFDSEHVESEEVVKDIITRFGTDRIFVKNSIELIKYYEASDFENIYNNLTSAHENVEFLVSLDYSSVDIMELKHFLKAKGLCVNTFESTLKFSDFKLNSDGMIPVVVQDYKTLEVLMVAYMNKESFELTVKTGKMTYYSRSRNELWIKGETSGHYQYVKSLVTDCDYDTILAKVHQVGVSCHTGKMSCFFNTLFKKAYNETNPLKVFEEEFNIILDRKINPKEGSYTNYLFDKGIDKILKKVGEEATEMVIAAKNPNAEELKYEISDFLYHMMVLMAECGLDWKDIVDELVDRR